MTPLPPSLRASLQRGLAIPACPLALNSQRRWDERRQRALARYYAAAGAGGLAVAVHTTQFAIRDPQVGLYQPLLELLAGEFTRADAVRNEPLFRIAGACGPTPQAVAEAETARSFGYHVVLLSLGALREATENELIAHCRAVAEVMPLIGFYLQPAAGGRLLPYSFWRRLAELENLVAVKIAPFNRYQTIDVIRAVVDSGRNDIALYTGNDDNIVLDLVTPFTFQAGENRVERRITGGLLGQWAVWTKKAVELQSECRALSLAGSPIPVDLARLAIELTDANAALFDAANGFAGCIAGLHEILRRQGLIEGIWCLDPNEGLGPGQRDEIDRVCRAYPHLQDNEFVARHRDDWLA